MSGSQVWARYRLTDGAVVGMRTTSAGATPDVPNGGNFAFLPAPSDMKGQELRVELTGPDQPVLVQRSELPVQISGSPVPADGVSELVVTVPVGSLATLPDDSTVEVDDGTLELTFDVAGMYTISVEHSLYLPGSVTVEAV